LDKESVDITALQDRINEIHKHIYELQNASNLHKDQINQHSNKLITIGRNITNIENNIDDIEEDVEEIQGSQTKLEDITARVVFHKNVTQVASGGSVTANGSLKDYNTMLHVNISFRTTAIVQNHESIMTIPKPYHYGITYNGAIQCCQADAYGNYKTFVVFVNTYEEGIRFRLMSGNMESGMYGCIVTTLVPS